MCSVVRVRNKTRNLSLIFSGIQKYCVFFFIGGLSCIHHCNREEFISQQLDVYMVSYVTLNLIEFTMKKLGSPGKAIGSEEYFQLHHYYECRLLCPRKYQEMIFSPLLYSWKCQEVISSIYYCFERAVAAHIWFFSFYFPAGISSLFHPSRVSFFSLTIFQ